MFGLPWGGIGGLVMGCVALGHCLSATNCIQLGLCVGAGAVAIVAHAPAAYPAAPTVGALGNGCTVLPAR